MRSFTFAAVAVLLGALTGCTGDETGNTSGTTTDPDVACQDFDTPWSDYSAGMIEVSFEQKFKMALLDADPTPPDLHANTWTVQLLDMADAPMSDGVVFDRVKPWMPDHGHGTTVEPLVGDVDSDGKVEVSDIDFRMPGVWTVTFQMQQTPAGPDNVVFSFCIDG